MSLSEVSSSQRIHIGFFGSTNTGKSSLVNSITNQDLSIVSEISGTTTDPVRKTMEILPLGPVVIIDTPGIDDYQALASKRIQRAFDTLDQTDLAVLVIDSTKKSVDQFDIDLLTRFKQKGIKCILALNKADLVSFSIPDILDSKTLELLSSLSVESSSIIPVSALKRKNITELKELISTLIPSRIKTPKPIIKDLIAPSDTVVLVIPIDSGAPLGRLILPQHLTLREILDAHAQAICVQPQELDQALKDRAIKLVVCDSQVFGSIKDKVPDDIYLTSFSILMARYKGDLSTFIKGASQIKDLKDNDRVLIAEACTHHRQCDDIGSVKLPKLLTKFTGKKLNFEFSSGSSFPKDLAGISLVIHCGGCMINEAMMKSRIMQSIEQSVSIVNYGIAISYMNGILQRAIKIFDSKP